MKTQDARYNHTHPQHRELMLPCYPQCQAVPEMLRKATPVAIDTFLAANYEEQNKVLYYIDSAARTVEHYTTGFRAEEAQAKIVEYRAMLALVVEAAKPYEAEYTTRRWLRYFLVTNGNGHVHRERNCSTCFPRTRYAWLVNLSGCDERAMVTEYGTDACTVCFPNAPSLAKQLNAVSKTRREREAARSARETKRAAAAATAAIKAIANPDGTPLMDQNGWRIRTLAAAKQELVHAAGTLQFAQPGSYSDVRRPQIEQAFERIAQAIGAKLDANVEVLKAAARVKAHKRGF